MASTDRMGGLVVTAAPMLMALLVLVPVALLAASHGWDGLYGQDAFFYHAYSVGELREALAEGRAPVPFTWPPGFPVLVAAVSALTGPSSLAGQVVSLLSAAAVPVLTWMLARELLSDRPGWVPIVAGLAAATSPHLWQSSAVVMADTSALAACTLGAWATARWCRGASRPWLALAAAAVAFAVMTRWVAAVPGIALGAAALIGAWRRRRCPAWRGALRELAPAVVAGGLVLAPVLGPMVTAALLHEPIPFSLALGSHGWNPANLLRSTLITADGEMRYPLPMLTFFLLEPARPYHLGPVSAALAVVGGGSLLVRRAVVPVMLVVVWPAVTLLALAGDGYQNSRFALLVLPPLAIAAAIGVETITRVLALRPAPWRRMCGVIVVGGVGVLLAVQMAAAWRFTDAFIVRFRADRAAIASLAARVPLDGTLISFGATLALRHDGRSVTDVSDLSTMDAGRILASAVPRWLLVPIGSPDDRWRGTTLGATLTMLLADPDIRLVAEDGGWSLWRAGQG